MAGSLYEKIKKRIVLFVLGVKSYNLQLIAYGFFSMDFWL